MSNIPTVTFQIIGPNEGVAEGTHHGLWFKVQSDPHHQTILSSD